MAGGFSRFPLRSPAADLALAALLACLAQAEVWTVGDPTGPRPLVAFTALVMTLSLAWRRRAPVAVATVVMAALIVLALVSNTPDVTVIGIAAIVLAMYSVAANCELRGALIGAAVVLVPSFVLEAVVDGEFGNFFFILVMNASVWIAGRAVRSQGSRAARLADRTVLLEREGEQKARAAVNESGHGSRASCTTWWRTASARWWCKRERSAVCSTPVRPPRARSCSRSSRPGATAEMRRLLGMLRKDDRELALAPQPSLVHLDQLVEQVRAAGMPVELRVEGEPVPLPPGVDLSAYRIVQEALTNALKHAGPARASVIVRYDEHELKLEIADSGRGAANGSVGGHGLIRMRERVALYGGELDTGSRAGEGYEVQARLPLGPASR